MNSRHRLLLIFLAGLLFSGMSVSAQTQNKDKWEFSVFAGSSNFSDVSAATPIAGSDQVRLVGLNFNRGLLLGVRITENKGPRWGAELEYAYSDPATHFSNLSANLTRAEIDQRVHSFTYSLVFYPMQSKGRLQPFLVGGLGTNLYYVTASSKAEAKAQGVALRDRWTLAGAWGGGVKYSFGEQLALRADFRDQIGTIPDYGFPETAPSFGGQVGIGFNPSGTLHNLQISGGVSFTWGSR